MVRQRHTVLTPENSTVPQFPARITQSFPSGAWGVLPRAYGACGLWQVPASHKPYLMITPQLGFPEHKNLSHTRGSHNLKLEKPKPTQGLVTGHHGNKKTGLLGTSTEPERRFWENLEEIHS